MTVVLSSNTLTDTHLHTHSRTRTSDYISQGCSEGRASDQSKYAAWLEQRMWIETRQAGRGWDALPDGGTRFQFHNETSAEC